MVNDYSEGVAGEHHSMLIHMYGGLLVRRTPYRASFSCVPIAGDASLDH